MSLRDPAKQPTPRYRGKVVSRTYGWRYVIRDHQRPDNYQIVHINHANTQAEAMREVCRVLAQLAYSEVETP